MNRPIVTSYINPPIPDRSHDWCAHYDGEEEAGNYGWGRTEADAIQDFKDNCAADHDERLDGAASLGHVQTTCIEHAYGTTQRLSFQIKVF